MKVPLCKLDEIPETGTKKIDFLGREALVFKVDGEPKAILNICMHLGGPMKLENCTLVCEWHGAEFDCWDGKRLKGPARRDSQLITLPTQVEDGTLKYVFGD
ncbi:Rieske (2Fe-2S) protein [candidate division KSB1 bacterium]|nr:Rieske (2Fe-2S) protein [candidate division KSB1 bacterium]NIR70860.1 Rieske (2Fe-2S) protein [candidate division KSB1 bacterium]NIS24646.1 Rieske (2Fe-2S) protein [candidate division KSB1 bacterium]NIT71548.1 Rieske (2Fe-2S) protein [candidate division KSB1 bacterium]NIU25246.1 Rieske (2Fe-2S) protein [candidate division KSB1 bacterium]